MSFYFTNERDEDFGLSRAEWADIIEIAFEHGWFPSNELTGESCADLREILLCFYTISVGEIPLKNEDKVSLQQTLENINNSGRLGNKSVGFLNWLKLAKTVSYSQ